MSGLATGAALMTTAWCVGDPDQVDTRLDRHQVSGCGTAWNENKIAGPGGGERGLGGVRGGVEDGDIGAGIPRGCQDGCEASGRRARDDGRLRLAQVTPLCG